MISVTLNTQPDKFTPVNAATHLYYQAVSASASLPAFQYVFDVYEIDQPTQTISAFVGEFTAPPRPITGDGIFTPYKALQSYVNNEPVDWDVTTLRMEAVDASIVEYITYYGFSYNPGFAFSTSNVGGTLSLQYTSAVGAELNDGDSLTLLMSTNQFNPQYNGVVDLVDTLSGLTNQPYGNTPVGPEYGTITNLQRMVGTGATAWAWNGTRQYSELQNFYTEFVLQGAPTSSWLTDYESVSLTFSNLNGKPTFLGQYETLGFLYDTSLAAPSVLGVWIWTYDQYGNQLNHYNEIVLYNAGYTKFEFGVGTQNLIDAYGVDFTGVYYYEIQLLNGYENIIGLITRSIDYECKRCYYQNYQITWLNPRGSYEYWNFNLDSQRTLSNTVNEYKKVLPWNYTIGARERTIMSQKTQVGYKINTNWVTQYDYAFLESLIYSSEVYSIEIGLSTPAFPLGEPVRVPIIITDNNYQTATYVRDQIFNLTLNFEYASLQNTQTN